MILVDPISEYPRKPGLRWTRWSHLCSDVSDEELHAFAARIGLLRSWFQEMPAARSYLSHYDVTPTLRARAVRAGAVEVSSRELVRRLRARIARQDDI
jgi:hypothetical protein